MKSSVRKYLAACATMVLLMLVLFPHHHHEGGAFCVSVQMCQKDGRINDEHTHHCHNLKLEQHHLFLPVGQEDLVALLAHDNIGGNGGCGSFGGYEGFGGGQPSFLPSDFWNNHYFYSYFFAATGTTCFMSADAALLAGCHGKHWKRRGPPTLVVM